MVIPVIYVNMTDIPTVQVLSATLLAGINAPDPSSGTHFHRTQRLYRLAREVKLKVIILDEFHDCVGTAGRGAQFLRFIKGAMNENLCVVPVGTEELAAVLARDAQLSSRFNFSRGRLGRVTDESVIKAIMVEATRIPAHRITDAAVQYVLKESKGILGHMLDLIEESMLMCGDLKLASLQRTRKTMDVLDHVL